MTVDVFHELLAVVVPVFVAMDPFGALPLVVSWLSELTPAQRQRQLRNAFLTATSLGLIFLVGEKWLLGILGVDVPDFLIAGGVILLVLAISDLVVSGGHETRGSVRASDLGVVPIGTPVLVGPATMTALIVLIDRYGLYLTVFAFLVNLAIAWVVLSSAAVLIRLLGRNGLRAASKVVSLLLAAIAVKYIRDGLVVILHRLAT